MTVSWRRSAEAPDRVANVPGAVVGGFARGLSAVSVLPHVEQNLAPARLVAPQIGQALGRAAPHASQNLLSGCLSEWQLGHSMSAPLPATFQLTAFSRESL
jgi:hypothetical protein